MRVRSVEDYLRLQQLVREAEERAIARVAEWIDANFEPDAVQLVYKPTAGKPGRHTIRDSAGDRLTVWYDALRGEVRWQ